MLFNPRALKSVLLLSATLCGVILVSAENLQKRAQATGIDISYEDVNWQTAHDNGNSFVYIQATAGKEFLDASFSKDFDGASSVNIIPGPYHFAIPSESTGTQQANFFLENYRRHIYGDTLPGALYIQSEQWNDYCFGLSPNLMVKWIHDFSDTYNNKVGRLPVIYTTADWWKTCTDNNNEFNPNPLWIGGDNGDLPGGWAQYTFWQSASGTPSGNQDSFIGDKDDLKHFARRW